MIRDAWFWACILVGPLIYWNLRPRLKPIFLTLLSTTYLAKLAPLSVALALGAGLGAYFVAPFADNRRREGRLIRWGMLIVLLAPLLCFKHLQELTQLASSDDSFASRIAPPLGVSFFTFRLLHFFLEVANGRLQRGGLSDFCAYLMLFPIFSAGPIEQVEHYRHGKVETAERALFADGLTRILTGVFKKLVLAEFMVSRVLQGGRAPGMAVMVESSSTSETWSFLFCFFVYNYLDFSGYSDIAIGGARLFGIGIAENFNWPWLAPSISEFWKRWHITLAAWTQRYVYMPIIARTRNPYLAVYATFITMGLWHAADASYLCWGLYHGTGVSIALTWARVKRKRKWTSQPPGILRYWGIPVTLAFVTGSSIFSSTSGLGTESLLKLLKSALGLG